MWTYTLDQSAVQNLDALDVVTDTITYTASNGSMQQITVTITGRDDAAVISGTFTGAVDEGDVGDVTTVTGALAITDVDGDDNPSFADVGSTQGDNKYGDFVLSGGVWTYTLDQSAVQNLDALDVVTDTITYTASNGSMQQITVTITGRDDAAVISGTFTGAVLEGDVGDMVTASGTLSISDADDNDNPIFADTTISTTHGDVSLIAGTWTFTVDQTTVQALDAGDVVNDFILFTASDGSIQGVTVTITGTDDASVVTGTFTGSTNEGNIGDAPVTTGGSIGISDLDQNDTPVFNDVTATIGDNGYGTFSLVAGTWTYTLDQNAVQQLDAGDAVTDTVTFVASDGKIRQVSVTIVGAADTPTTVGIAALAVNEDAPVTYINLASAFDDFEDADSALTYLVTSNTNASLFSGINSSGANLSLAYTPDASGSANVTLRATDSQGGFVETTFSISVAPVNDAPILSTNTGTTVANSETITLTAAALGAVDVDNIDAEIVYTLTNTPDGGTLQRGALSLGVGASFTQADIDNNLVTYRAADDADGNGTFTFTLTDAAGASIGTHEFQVTIEGGSSEDEAVAFIEDEIAQLDDPIPDVVSETDPADPTEAAEDPKTPTEKASLLDGGHQFTPELDTNGFVGADIDLGNSDGRTNSFAGEERRERRDDEPALTIPVDEVLDETVAELADGIDFIELTDDEKVDRITHALQQALDSLGSDLDDAAASQFAHDQVVMAVGHIGGASLSAGVLAWLFRAGSLLASVLSVMPLWTRMDPLPVLLAKKRRDEDEDLDDDEKEAARILDGNYVTESEEYTE